LEVLGHATIEPVGDVDLGIHDFAEFPPSLDRRWLATFLDGNKKVSYVDSIDKFLADPRRKVKAKLSDQTRLRR